MSGAFHRYQALAAGPNGMEPPLRRERRDIFAEAGLDRCFADDPRAVRQCAGPLRVWPQRGSDPGRGSTMGRSDEW